MAHFTLRSDGGSNPGQEYYLSPLQTQRLLGAIEAGDQFITLNLAMSTTGVHPRIIQIDDIASVQLGKVKTFTREVLDEFLSDQVVVYAPPVALAGTLREFYGRYVVEDRGGTFRLVDVAAVNNLVPVSDLAKEKPVRLLGDVGETASNGFVVRCPEMAPIVDEVLERHGNPALDTPTIVVAPDQGDRRAIFANLAIALTETALSKDEDILIVADPRAFAAYKIDTVSVDELMRSNPVLGRAPLCAPAGIEFKTKFPTVLVLVEDFNDFKVQMPPYPGLRAIIVANVWKHVDGWRMWRDGKWSYV